MRQSPGFGFDKQNSASRYFAEKVKVSRCLFSGVHTVEGCEKFIFWSFFVALGEKLLLIITKQGKYFFLNFEFV